MDFKITSKNFFSQILNEMCQVENKFTLICFYCDKKSEITK